MVFFWETVCFFFSKTGHDFEFQTGHAVFALFKPDMIFFSVFKSDMKPDMKLRISSHVCFSEKGKKWKKKDLKTPRIDSGCKWRAAAPGLKPLRLPRVWNRQTDKECAWGRLTLLLIKRPGRGLTLSRENSPLRQLNTTLRGICGTWAKGFYVWRTSPCQASAYWSVFRIWLNSSFSPSSSVEDPINHWTKRVVNTRLTT